MTEPLNNVTVDVYLKSAFKDVQTFSVGTNGLRAKSRTALTDILTHLSFLPILAIFLTSGKD